MSQPRHILVLGAGRSATVLVDYLIKNADTENWRIVVADADLAVARAKTNGANCTEAVELDIRDAEKRVRLIGRADIIISMMPPTLHFVVAQDCIALNKNLLTASYIDAQIRTLETGIETNGLLFLCEMGLDPGIDHMSAMRLIDGIHAQAGIIGSFKSHCGGLVAPKSDNNPWHYKISWNPRNVITAGKTGALYLEAGKVVQENYEQLFNGNHTVYFPKLGHYAWYANRDSLPYIPLYGLQTCHTFIRTTLRHPAFLAGWQKVVAWKLTDETVLFDTENLSSAQFFATHFAKHHLQKTVMEAMHEDDSLKEQFIFLGLNDNTDCINQGLCTAAGVLQYILERKWALSPNDQDLVLMMHEVEYRLQGSDYRLESRLVVKGNDGLHTAMAKTVGLPMGIAAKLILNKSIAVTGLQLPTKAEIYGPVLQELEKEGICFEEKLIKLP